jgi:hypothetical protein
MSATSIEPALRQRFDALDRANAIRSGRTAVKRDLRSHEVVES